MCVCVPPLSAFPYPDPLNACRPTKQTTIQPIIQHVSRHASQHEPTNHPTNQPTIPHVIHSTNHPACHPARICLGLVGLPSFLTRPWAPLVFVSTLVSPCVRFGLVGLPRSWSPVLFTSALVFPRVRLDLGIPSFAPRPCWSLLVSASAFLVSLGIGLRVR